MNERQYFQARKKALADYEDNVRSLDKTWILMHGCQPPKQPNQKAKRQGGGEADDRAGSQLSQVLVTIIAEMPSQFNTLDVDKVLKAEHCEFANTSRSTVTHALKRLAAISMPPLAIIEPGKGKRPTRYSKQFTQDKPFATQPADVNVDDI